MEWWGIGKRRNNEKRNRHIARTDTLLRNARTRLIISSVRSSSTPCTQKCTLPDPFETRGKTPQRKSHYSFAKERNSLVYHRVLSAQTTYCSPTTIVIVDSSLVFFVLLVEIWLWSRRLRRREGLREGLRRRSRTRRSLRPSLRSAVPDLTTARMLPRPTQLSGWTRTRYGLKNCPRIYGTACTRTGSLATV